MYTRRSMATLFGLLLLSGACSSESDDVPSLPIRNSGSDAAFSYYDANADKLVTAAEIHKAEKSFGATQVTSEDVALKLVGDYDFDADQQLDNLEFTGLVNAKVLAGPLHHPEWTSPVYP